MNDISECQVGDKVVDNRSFYGLMTVSKVDMYYIFCEGIRFKFRKDTGCLFNEWPTGVVKDHFIRPASPDDIARHDKKVLVDRLNSTEFSRFSIEKLERIDKEVSDE